MWQKGQTLIEVIVAVTAAALLLTALTSIILSSYSNVGFSEAEAGAGQAAQDGIDYLRNLHDTNYGDTTSSSPPSDSYAYFLQKGSGCLGTNEVFDPLLSSCATTPNYGSYIRNINLTNSASECGGTSGDVRITVTVKWNDGKCKTTAFCHNTSLVTCLTSASVIPTF